MAIRSIENLKTSDLGDTDVIVCPVCRKATALRLFEAKDHSVVSYLKKRHNDSFAVCPKCNSVFCVNQNYVTLREQGTVCRMTESDLTLLFPGNA